MLSVTDNAMQMCSATVQQLSGAQPNTKCLRFKRRKEGVSVSFEIPRNDDEIVEHQGQPVLAVPQEIAGALSKMTLDVGQDGRLVLS